MSKRIPSGTIATWRVVILSTALSCLPLAAQQVQLPTEQPTPKVHHERADDYNKRLQELVPHLSSAATQNATTQEYRLGAEDLLEVSVFDAPDLNRTVRISSRGEISLPLLGVIQAVGLTVHELEVVLEELLRRTYMREPHVAVFVREMQSHPVSVFGAVRKPGVYQIRGTKSLVELLSLAEGLADDAGDTVVVMRGAELPDVPMPSNDLGGSLPTEPRDVHSASSVSKAAPPTAVEAAEGIEATDNATEVSLKSLLESSDRRDNLLIHPGDVVKVRRAGVVYVVGEVKRPGGFVLKTNENITVLQALALAEGMTRTSAKTRARIIRTDDATRTRQEIAINLDKILSGKANDPTLRPNDIVFVPNSSGRSALYRGAEAAVSIAGGLAVYRR